MQCALFRYIYRQYRSVETVENILQSRQVIIPTSM
jgi:hypothetical protein